MVSVRHLANCIGLSGDISIVKEFFGYRSSGHSDEISLLEQSRLLRGLRIDLNAILTGEENFNDENKQEIDAAVQQMRRIYAQAQIGIGLVGHYGIPEADARESGVIGSMLTDDDSKSITNDWSVDNDALDVFFILKWDLFQGGALGRSVIDGHCDKANSSLGFESTGSVISIESKSPKVTGIVLAHEVGHYLGLDHIGDLDSDELDMDGDGETTDEDIALLPASLTENLMFPRVSKEGTKLNSSQAEEMKEHCFIKPPC